jgi:hypothetical protein
MAATRSPFPVRQPAADQNHRGRVCEVKRKKEKGKGEPPAFLPFAFLLFPFRHVGLAIRVGIRDTGSFS